MRGLYLLLFGLSCAGSVKAQRDITVSLLGVVTDSASHPIEYVTVSLHDMKDSTLVTGAVTDSTGGLRLLAFLA